jgi:hypothetical protein
MAAYKRGDVYWKSKGEAEVGGKERLLLITHG